MFANIEFCRPTIKLANVRRNSAFFEKPVNLKNPTPPTVFAYLRSWKLLWIHFSSLKPVEPNFDSYLRIFGHIQVFVKKKLQRPLSLFRFFAVPVLQKIYLLQQFSTYRHAVCGILLTTKLSINPWNRFLIICLKNFLRLFKVKNFF